MPARDAVGTMDQDRTTAIAGTAGRGAAHDPGRGEAQHQPRPGAQLLVPPGGGRAVQPRAGVRVARCPCCRATSAPSAPRPSGVNGRITLSGGREVQRRRPVHARSSPRSRRPRWWRHRSRYLMSQRLRARSRSTSSTSTVSSLETVQSATLQRAWIERTGPHAPGIGGAAAACCCGPTAARRDPRPSRSAFPASAPAGPATRCW